MPRSIAKRSKPRAIGSWRQLGRISPRWSATRKLPSLCCWRRLARPAAFDPTRRADILRKWTASRDADIAEAAEEAILMAEGRGDEDLEDEDLEDEETSGWIN